MAFLAIPEPVLRSFVEAATALVTEARVHADPDKLWMRAFDMANIAMVSIEIDREAFDEYHGNGEELGIDFAKLKTALTGIPKGSEIEVYRGGPQKLRFCSGNCEYAFTCLDVNTIRKDPNEPSIELPLRFAVDGSALKTAVKGCGAVSDKATFTVDAEKVYLFAEGDVDTVRYEIGEAPGQEPIASLFDLGYLKDIVKVAGKASRVGICMGEDHPIRISAPIADALGTVSYMIAPRIEAV